MLATGCPHYTPLGEATRTRLADQYAGEDRYLAQSVYAGPFYDDDRYVMWHARKFEQLGHLRTPEGRVWVPPPATSIVPAGRKVRIDRIEFPTGDVVFGRPLFTPRYSTWVWLSLADEAGHFDDDAPARHVMVLPEGIPDREVFDQWLDAWLTPTDPRPWLDGLSDERRAAVAQKRVLVGMDYRTLVAAWGHPDRLTEDQLPTTAETLEVAVYGPTAVILRDGRVDRVSSGAVSDAGDAVAGGIGAPAPR